MSDLLQPASLASWPELGAEMPASNRKLLETQKKSTPNPPPPPPLPLSPSPSFLRVKKKR